MTPELEDLQRRIEAAWVRNGGDLEEVRDKIEWYRQQEEASLKPIDTVDFGELEDFMNRSLKIIAQAFMREGIEDGMGKGGVRR